MARSFRGEVGSDEEVAAVDEVSNHDAAQVDQLVGKYVVSISGNQRRLHRVGSCYRVPGADYARYEILGDTEPDPSLYNGRCKFCGRAGGAAHHANLREASSPSTASSSSSST